MPDQFKPLKARCRASFAAGATKEPRLERIDKENEVLHGVQITLEGEAKGHDLWLDRAFCEDVAAAGNAAGEPGVKVRFGHPAMCSDALGTYLGRARNFRVVDLTRKEGDGEMVAGVLADIYIAAESHSAPSGDLGKWVLEAAENSPDTFGQSIVFTYADLKSTNEKGEPILRSEFESSGDFHRAAGENKIFAVLGKLLGTDFTDSPAATDGVFSAGDLAAEASEMLDEHPEIAATLKAHPEKAVEFLERIGMLDVLQNARLSGLQAAKDKEIAALQQELKEARETPACYGEIAQECDKLKAEKADLDDRFHKLTDAYAGLEKELAGKNAEIENFKSVIEANQKDLAAAKERGEQLSGELETTRADLAATREHLAAWEAHASDHGANVNTPPGDVFCDFAQAVKSLGYTEAARKFPALRDAYNIKHKKTHKE